eukprot:4585980-Amphidinium_carterae.2
MTDSDSDDVLVMAHRPYRNNDNMIGMMVTMSIRKKGTRYHQSHKHSYWSTQRNQDQNSIR